MIRVRLNKIENYSATNRTTTTINQSIPFGIRESAYEMPSI